MRHVQVVLGALGILATTAVAAPAAPLVCAIVDVFDCSKQGRDCLEVTSEAVGVPDLIRLDRAEQSMTALDAEFAGSMTKLGSLTKDGGKTTARAREGDRDLVLAVEDESGDAILTVSDGKMVLVAYGECSER